MRMIRKNVFETSSRAARRNCSLPVAPEPPAVERRGQSRKSKLETKTWLNFLDLPWCSNCKQSAFWHLLAGFIDEQADSSTWCTRIQHEQRESTCSYLRTWAQDGILIPFFWNTLRIRMCPPCQKSGLLHRCHAGGRRTLLTHLNP